MQVQRQFDDKILVQKIESMPIDELRKSLGLIQGEQKRASQPSKWAQLVERNKKNPINLGDYTEEDRQYRKDFREGFEFNHDKE